METWLAAMLAAALLALAIGRLKLFIGLSYRRRDGDDHLAVDVYTLGRLVRYHLEIPQARIASRGGLPWPEAILATARGRTETSAKREQRFVRTTWRIFRYHPRHWQKLMNQFRYFTRLYKRATATILVAVNCEKLTWRTGLGTGDAALTSVAAGLLWQLQGQTYAYMQRRLKSMPHPSFRVVPLYDREGLDIELECIFSIRVGNVINTIVTAIQFLGKGDNNQWKNTRSKVS